MFGIWTRRNASHPRFNHSPQPQEPPGLGKITRYLVKEQYYMWLLYCAADGKIRICVPMPDVIGGQLDEALKMLLGTGGEGTERTSPQMN